MDELKHYRPYRNRKEFLTAKSKHGPGFHGFDMYSKHEDEVQSDCVKLYTGQIIMFKNMPGYYWWTDGTPCAIKTRKRINKKI